jgi:O-Antigen ligase
MLSIVLIRLPVLIGHQSVIAIIYLIAFAACVAWGISRHRAIPSYAALATILVYVACTDVTVVRGSLAHVYVNREHAISDSLTYLAITLIGFLLVTTSRNRRELRQAIVAITLAPGVYALVNALLYLANVKSATVTQQGIGTLTPATLLEVFHIYMNRVQFPMATGVNSTGIVAGAGLAGCFVLTRYRATRRWITVPCMAGCLFCIVLGDSRTALFISIVAAIYFSWSRRAPAARWIAVAVPILPVLVVAGIALLNGSVGSALSRGGSTGSANNFESGNNRLRIWEAAWEVIRHPSVQQLYGWGANGHITSGVSERYAHIFASLPHPLEYSTHNLVIQTIFDSGYVGLIVLTAAVWVALSCLVRYIRLEPSRIANALVAILAVTLLSGTTEVSPSYGTQEALIATLLAMGAAAGLVASKCQPRSSPIAAAADQDVTRDRALVHATQ